MKLRAGPTAGLSVKFRRCRPRRYNGLNQNASDRLVTRDCSSRITDCVHDPPGERDASHSAINLFDARRVHSFASESRHAQPPPCFRNHRPKSERVRPRGRWFGRPEFERAGRREPGASRSRTDPGAGGCNKEERRARSADGLARGGPRASDPFYGLRQGGPGRASDGGVAQRAPAGSPRRGHAPQGLLRHASPRRPVLRRICRGSGGSTRRCAGPRPAGFGGLQFRRGGARRLGDEVARHRHSIQLPTFGASCLQAPRA